MNFKPLAALIAAAVILGCRDDLTSPGDCPALCPGGQPTVLDTVILADPQQDSSFAGYINPGLGTSLRISNNLPASDDRALVQFLPVPDSILVRDTMRTFTTDSISMSFFLQARDSLATNLRLLLYRVAPGLDTTTTFAGIDPLLVPANLIDSIPIPDTLGAGTLRKVFSGAELSKLATTPADSGRIALALAIAADGPTGIRIGSIASGTAPVLLSFVDIGSPDTAIQKQVIVRGPSFTGFVERNPPALNPVLLTVGGVPSARSVIRFTLPQAIRDSATLVRATLELLPASPVIGLPGDSAFLDVRNLIIDLGAKSPVLTSPTLLGRSRLPEGSADTVMVEILPLVQLWQGVDSLPQAVIVSLSPEASSFTRAVFQSTRSPGAGAPRLRLSYFKDFPFQRP